MRKHPSRIVSDQTDPPNYARIVRALSDADLLDEVELGRGEPEYRRALEAERLARQKIIS